MGNLLGAIHGDHMTRIKDLRSFLKEYQNHEQGIKAKDWHYYWWIPLDRPILTACKEHPDHSDYSEIFAKIALVNRMYRSQLGRGKKLKEQEPEDAIAHSLRKSGIDN